MAQTPLTNEAFVREVDDEMRRDQAQRFFSRWGRWLIAGVGLLLAATGGWLYWQHRQTEQAGTHAEALAQALTDVAAGSAGEAKGRPALEALAKDGGSYATLARLTLADLAMDKGDAKAAAAAYGAIATDTGAPKPFRDLALVRQTAAEFDALPPATVETRLRDLAVAGSPWFGSAGELIALAQIKAGRPADAGRTFAALARDASVPSTIRSRAVQMTGVLGVDAAPSAVDGAGTKE